MPDCIHVCFRRLNNCKSTIIKDFDLSGFYKIILYSINYRSENEHI